MTAHTLMHRGSRRPAAVRGTWNGTLQLGWLHFWLLTVILGGMLGLVGLVFFAHLTSF